MSVPNIMTNSCTPEFFLSGTRVAMVNPVLTYTKATAAFPIGHHRIYPGLHEKNTGTCGESPAKFGQNGPRLQGQTIARITRPLSKSTIQRMRTLRNYTQDSCPTDTTSIIKQNRNSVLIGLTSNHSANNNDKKSAKSHGCATESTAFLIKELTNVPSDIQPHPPDIPRSTFSGKIECNNEQKPKSANTLDHHNAECEASPRSVKRMADTDSTVSIKDILELVMHDKELGASEASEEDDNSDKTSLCHSTLSVKQVKKRRQRWKSGRKSRLKNHRQKKGRSVSIATPAELRKNNKHLVLMDAQTNITKPLKVVKHSSQNNDLRNKVIAGAIHRNVLNATQTVQATFSLSAEGHPSLRLSTDTFLPPRRSQNGFVPRRAGDGTRNKDWGVRPLEVERTMKVYLSQAQSSTLHELGMDFPGAPPATPMPDHLQQYEYVPCMYDIRAQRAVKMQLEGILAKELKHKEKLMEEKLRQDRQLQKQQEKALRQQQRREIYALNKVMTELENRNFETFIATHGLNEKKARKK